MTSKHEPGGDIYHAAVARRGGHEYTGGPVEWDPQPEDRPACPGCPVCTASEPTS